MEENKPIIIADMKAEVYLHSIAKRAMRYDEIIIQFIDKHISTAEYVIGLLTGGMGWIEDERSKKDVLNDRCKFETNNFCDLHKKTCDKRCSDYKKMYTIPMRVNEVILEKVAQAIH